MKFLLFLALFKSLPSYGALPPQESATYLFSYKVEIPKPEPGVSKVEVWLPLAADTKEQSIIDMTVTTPLKYEITREIKFGNKILYAKVTAFDSLPAAIEINYKVHRLGASAHFPNSFSDRQYWQASDYLGINKRIPINGKIAQIATLQTQGARSKDEKIKKIYQYVTESMTYNKEGTGWGQGDAVWACDNKRGNCTDFHSLLMGMARSQDIPARFEMGFPISEKKEGVIAGYHCWARVYSEKSGWIPLDSSEAKNTGKLFEYFGHLPANRIQFSTGRDILLEPRQAGEALNYFIYPYLELDGKKSELYKKEFSFKKI